MKTYRRQKGGFWGPLELRYKNGKTFKSTCEIIYGKRCQKGGFFGLLSRLNLKDKNGKKLNMRPPRVGLHAGRRQRGGFLNWFVPKKYKPKPPKSSHQTAYEKRIGLR